MSVGDARGGFAAGFDGTLSPGRVPVVLSIDLMYAYFDPDSPLCLPSDAFLAVAAQVIASARRAAVPVIHTVVRYREGSGDGGIFIDKVPALRTLIGESTAGATMPSVAPTGDEKVIVKHFASAFFDTDLASTLRSDGVDTVIIIGTSTSGCVRATAVDAIQYGFVPLIVGDAVGDRNDAVHNASLYDLQAKYAEVIDSTTAVAYLLNARRPPAG